MKRVIILNHGLHVAGVSRTLINFANALVEHGYDVTIKIEIDDFTLEKELDPRVKRSLFLREPHPFGLRIKGFLRFYRYWRSFLFKLPVRWQYKLTVGKGYDIEIAFNRGAAARIIAASSNKKSVKLTWVHTDYLKNGSFLAGFKTIEEAHTAYSAYDSVICVSQQAQRAFTERFGDTGNLCTRFNVIDTARIKEMAEEKVVEKTGKTVLSVGRICEAKNYSLLVEAANLLKKKEHDITWWIVGDGELRDDLEAKIKSSKADNVKLLGAHNNPYPYFKNADLYLSTSIYEGLSTTTIEALIVGKPVIVTDCVGMRDILGDSEYGMVVPITAAEVAAAVEKMLFDEDCYTHFSQKAVERSTYFDKERCFSAIEELLER